MAQTNSMTPDQLRRWRYYVEALIERAIEILDTIDGDPDLEDGEDGEPSLASPSGGENQMIWCAGADDDREWADGNRPRHMPRASARG